MEGESVYGSLIDGIGASGIYIITGKNGTGKSRFFRGATANISKQIIGGNGKFSRLICMAGTPHDKYGREIYGNRSINSEIVYLGYKVNSNMFSQVSPFRKLFQHVFNPIAATVDACKSAAHFLATLNLASGVELKTRVLGPSARDYSKLGPQSIQIDFADYHLGYARFREEIEFVQKGVTGVYDVIFARGDRKYNLADLSSGEKSYILAVLGTIFCGRIGSITFYDEPENSLHPAWHLKIIEDLSRIMNSLHPRSALVIATHSPLVASSVRNSRTFLCNFPAGQKWSRSQLHGKTNDAVLAEQFELFSPRSKEVARLVQECLTEIAHDRVDSPEFRRASSMLIEMDLVLNEDDPISEVLKTIARFREGSND